MTGLVLFSARRRTFKLRPSEIRLCVAGPFDSQFTLPSGHEIIDLSGSSD